MQRVYSVYLRFFSGLRRPQREAWSYHLRYLQELLFLVFHTSSNDLFFLPRFPYLTNTLVESGESVTVEDEVVVINSIVLPNKTLNVSVQEEIIL